MRSTRHIPYTRISYQPSVVIVAQGRKSGRLEDQQFVYDASNYLVLTIPLPFECETLGSPDQPLLAVSISLTPSSVAEILLEMETPPAPPAYPPRAVYASPLGPDISDAVIRLLETFKNSNDSRILGPQIVREITYRVINGPRGAALRALAAPHSSFGQITRVLRRIHSDFNGVLDISELARDAGMSVSTFHTHFKAVTSSSPLQYIKSTRLHKARMLMVHEGENAANAARRVGYESVSQFSREFKRFFNGTPVEVADEMRSLLNDPQRPTTLY